jgi:putative oxidoreductase
MFKNWFISPVSGAPGGIAIIRTAVAIILCIHGVHGVMSLKNMAGFGHYLSSEGFPFGAVLAWLVVTVQIGGSVALILRRLVVPACFGHIIVLVTGIVLIHASDGWFVVGPGQDGMEYSVTLIACLVTVLWAHWPRPQKA